LGFPSFDDFINHLLANREQFIDNFEIDYFKDELHAIDNIDIKCPQNVVDVMNIVSKAYQRQSTRYVLHALAQYHKWLSAYLQP
jgi:hypothetical protein